MEERFETDIHTAIDLLTYEELEDLYKKVFRTEPPEYLSYEEMVQNVDEELSKMRNISVDIIDEDVREYMYDYYFDVVYSRVKIYKNGRLFFDSGLNKHEIISPSKERRKYKGRSGSHSPVRYTINRFPF